ncbi:MAG TPA: sugar phosphate isomerase/epimerase family protein [Planctomycetota bacterium]|nr:sugar phosphate isomerase/epimerase family protein [Planctomycetota bacterium]
MSQTRRDFLLRTAQIGAVGSILSRGFAQEPAKPAPGAVRPAPAGAPLLFDISLAEWSLHTALQSGAIKNLDFPVLAAKDYDIRCVEYVNSFFKDSARDEKYLKELNLRCHDNGVTNHLIMCDGEGSLGASKKEERAQAVENHKRWVDAAKTLGCKTIRVNAAGDGTREEHQSQAADGLVQLATYADPLGINVIVENHGGVTSDGAWLAGVMKKAAHPRVGTLPDFGNFNLGDGKQYDRYQGTAELMPYAKAVSAKSYDFDEQGNETTIDYEKMLKIVLAANYHSWLGIEYEGSRLSEKDGILATKALLVRLRSKLA